jgi:protein TonB
MSASRQFAQFSIVVAAHLVLLGALLTYQPARQVMVQIIPVVARIVPGERVEPPAPPAPVRKSTPKPQHAPAPKQKPAVPKPIIAAETPPATPPAMTAAIVPSPAPAANAAPAAAATTPSATQSSANAQATWSPPRSDAAYLNNPKPAYPAVSLRLGEAGRVVLSVLVSASGAAEQVSVRTSSGYERLDQAALKAVKKWKFIPARRGDQAVAAQVLVPIMFTTESE